MIGKTFLPSSTCTCHTLGTGESSGVQVFIGLTAQPGAAGVGWGGWGGALGTTYYKGEVTVWKHPARMYPKDNTGLSKEGGAINAEVKFYLHKSFLWVKVIQPVNHNLPPTNLEISGGRERDTHFALAKSSKRAVFKTATLKIPPTVKTIL